MDKYIRVTKKFTFDMAHALYGYNGPCSNIHGHTYHLCVTIIGKPINDSSKSENGMVMDFGNIKKIVKENIINVYDHSLLLNKNASYAQSSIFQTELNKVLLVEFQPTCENILSHLVDLIVDKFHSPSKLIKMRLDETPSSYAEWYESDNQTIF